MDRRAGRRGALAVAVVALAAQVALPLAGQGGVAPPRMAPAQLVPEADARAVVGAQDLTTDDSGGTTDPDDGSTTDPTDGSTTDPDDGSTTTVVAPGTPPPTPPPGDRSPIAELLDDGWPWLLVLLVLVPALALGARRILRRDGGRAPEVRVEARRDDGEVTLRETGHPTVRVVARLDPAEGATTIEEVPR